MNFLLAIGITALSLAFLALLPCQEGTENFSGALVPRPLFFLGTIFTLGRTCRLGAQLFFCLVEWNYPQ